MLSLPDAYARRAIFMLLFKGGMIKNAQGDYNLSLITSFHFSIAKQEFDRFSSFFAFPFPIAGGSSDDFAPGVYEKIDRNAAQAKLGGELGFGIQ